MATVVNRVEELLARKQREENRRISDAVASQEIGMSKSSYQSWRLNKITRFDSDQIVKLCRYFGVGPGELFILVENDENPRASQESRSAVVAA